MYWDPADTAVELTSYACTLQPWDTVEVRSKVSAKRDHHQDVATIALEHHPSCLYLIDKSTD